MKITTNANLQTQRRERIETNPPDVTDSETTTASKKTVGKGMVGVSAVVLMVEISKMATVVTVELETTAAETAEAARKV